MTRSCLLLTCLAAFAGACVDVNVRRQDAGDQLDAYAEPYVKLVLALGQHDAAYVDAFYGPPEWRKEAEKEKRSLQDIDEAADVLQTALKAAAPPAEAEELVRLRHTYLTRQLESLRARVAMLSGRKFRFDEESKALYDAVAPTYPEAEFAKTLAELDALIPGKGPLADRYEEFRKRFFVPSDRLDATFRVAIAGCRRETLAHVTLPSTESFTVEYVNNKSWSAYNWYQGNYRSIIQVNTDLPVALNTTLVLACHEGYPGHHVNNVLIEKNLVRDRGWVEFSVYPLYSPQSLIAEGSANFGVDLAFPQARRIEFAKQELFPAAGLDPSGAETYFKVGSLIERLTYAPNEAARRYLDGEIDAKKAAQWLQQFGLYSAPRAAQQVRFIDENRSYVINYNLGKDLVAAYVERQAGSPPATDRRWRAFETLLSSPRLPSGLK